SFEDYPRLIRLNPNIPWKTRGNGAVSLKFRTEDPEEAFEEACRTVSEYSETEYSADPGVVLSTLEQIPRDISEFADRALSEVVSRSEAVHLMKKHNIRFLGWGRQRGLIGALAAIGCRLGEDTTYELIAFRSEENWGGRRSVEPVSIIDMSRKTYPYTFNNYDEETGRILITPRGPDPVLLGVRGEDPETVLRAYRMLKIGETVSGHMIFKTNQGTGAHLKPKLDLGGLKAYRSGHFEGVVSKKPKVGEGGHVYIEVKNREGVTACAAYEPTGGFRKAALSLIPGDRVEIGGSVRRRTRRHRAIINMEYLHTVELARDIRFTNPTCRGCGRRMTSQGRGQGFRCDSCGFEDRKAGKIEVEKPRTIRKELYIPPPRAQRHLTRPQQRYLPNRQVGTVLIGRWFEPAGLVTRLKI
ncbi:MAG: DUF1743 domain-containing protein, partial [Nitrososphaerales archaeon]